MAYNSSFTGQQADVALQKAAVIQMDGGGTQFLGNDGAYHDISSLPTISFSLFPSDSGTLSAENLQTYLSVAANGVAIVLGGVDANTKPSGIANFMDMGEEMYMSYGYSSFFREIDGTENGKGTIDSAAVVVSVNKTTGAYLKSVTNVRLLNNGDGDMFLADDGTYKSVSEKYSARTFVLFSSEFDSNNQVLKTIEAPSDWSEQMVVTADSSNTPGLLFTSDVSSDETKYGARFTYTGSTYPAQGNWKLVNNTTGDVMQILAVVIQSQKVLTESEYAALGTTPETDGVLYFVTPDGTGGAVMQ